MLHILGDAEADARPIVRPQRHRINLADRNAAHLHVVADRQPVDAVEHGVEMVRRRLSRVHHHADIGQYQDGAEYEYGGCADNDPPHLFSSNRLIAVGGTAEAAPR